MSDLVERLRVNSCRLAHETPDRAATRRIEVEFEAADEIEKLRNQLVRAKELSEAQLEAGAQALADDVWHPPQKWESLPPSEQNKFKRQALLALKAALTLPDDYGG